MATMVSIGARLARLTFSPDILLTDGEARLLADTPAIGAAGAIEGWMPFGRGLRDAGLGPPPRGDGRQPDRPVRQPEPVGVRAAAAPDPADVRCAGRAGQHDQPRHQLLGRQPLQAGVRATTSTWCPGSVGTRSIPTTRHTGSSTSTGWCRTSACSTSTVPTTPCGRCRCIPASMPNRSRENTSFEVHGLDEAEQTRLADRRRAEAPPRGIDPKSLRDKEIRS